MTEAVQTNQDAGHGPLLRGLLAAQERDAAGAGQLPLRRAAAALAAYSRELGHPVLEPVSPGGHRLAGAALLLSGDISLRRPDRTVRGERVLLVEGVTVGVAGLAAQALRLRAAGALSIHAFAVDAPELGWNATALDGWQVMSPHAAASR
jgi:hypothetical protein